MSYKSVFQGMARTYIPTLLKKGFSASKSLRWLKRQGLGYRKTNFLADWREFTGRAKKADVTKYIPKKYKPTAATLSGTSENLARQYSYVYQVKGRDSLTGDPKTQNWRYSTDNLTSMEDVEAIIEEDIKKVEYEVRITDITLVPGEVLSRIRL